MISKKIMKKIVQSTLLISPVFFVVSCGAKDVVQSKDNTPVAPTPENPNPTNPGNGGSTNPGNGGTTSPGNGGSTNPGNGGTTSPGNGGSTNPGSGGSTNPGNGGSTNPGSGGTTNPGSGGSTNPGNGGSTNPGSGESTNPGTQQPPTNGFGWDPNIEKPKVEKTIDTKVVKFSTNPQDEPYSTLKTISPSNAILNIEFNQMIDEDNNQKIVLTLARLVPGGDGTSEFTYKKEVSSQKNKTSYEFNFSDLNLFFAEEGQPYYVKEVTIGKRLIQLPDKKFIFPIGYNPNEIILFNIKDVTFLQNESNTEKSVISFDGFSSSEEIKDKKIKIVLQDEQNNLIQSDEINGNDFYNDSGNAYKKLKATFTSTNGLKPKTKYSFNKIIVDNSGDLALSINITPFSFISAFDISETTNAELAALESDLGSVLKTKFSSSAEWNTALNKIETLFNNIINGYIEGDLNDDNFLNSYERRRLLRNKLSAMFIKNNLNVDDASNYVDVSNLEPSKEPEFNVFDFSTSNNSIKPLLGENAYGKHLEFFKDNVKYAANATLSAYGRDVYENNRFVGPAMQHAIALKLNGWDNPKNRNIIGNTNATGWLFPGSTFDREVVDKMKLTYLTNNLWISIFYNYRNFLKSNDDTVKIRALKNIKILLQAIYHGKNAKEIFSKFLAGNANYDVNNFLTKIKKINYKGEPGFLDGIVSASSESQNYSNILVYLNYLTMNESKSKALDSYFLEGQRNENVYPSFKGARSTDSQETKNNYYNMIHFVKITKNNSGKITEINFNDYK